MRNPRSLKAMLGQSVFMGLLSVALFSDVGNPNNVDLNKPSDFMRFLFNINGLCFMMANNLSQGASSSVILQIPMQMPVYKREIANQMYTPSTYFWGRYLSNLAI